MKRQNSEAVLYLQQAKNISSGLYMHNAKQLGRAVTKQNRTLMSAEIEQTLNSPALPPKTGKEKQLVYTVRDWKEYVGESLLIIFSVLLALVLTEYFNKLHEKENTKAIIQSIIAELRHNKKAIQETRQYNAAVFGRIDSAIVRSDMQDQLVRDGEFHLEVIAPQGILYRYLDDVAWTIAKANNITSRADIETVTTLTRVYQDQAKMMKVEDEMAKVIFDRASRDPKQIGTTLRLIRDIYRGWAVDRADGVLLQIDQAISRLESY